MAFSIGLNIEQSGDIGKKFQSNDRAFLKLLNIARLLIMVYISFVDA